MNCTRRCSRGGDSGSGCCRREPGPVIQLRASEDGARPASRWLSSSGTSFPSGHAVPQEKPNKQRHVGSKIWKTKLRLSEFPSTPKTMQAEGFWEQPWQKTPVSKAKGAGRACHQPPLGDCAPARKAIACPLPVSETPRLLILDFGVAHGEEGLGARSSARGKGFTSDPPHRSVPASGLSGRRGEARPRSCPLWKRRVPAATPVPDVAPSASPKRGPNAARRAGSGDAEGAGLAL